jgi:hypothetical protein
MVVPVMEPKTKNKVSEIAKKKEISYEEFLGKCVMRGLNIDTAKAAWDQEYRTRGFNRTTKIIIADILGRDVADVFGEEK